MLLVDDLHMVYAGVDDKIKAGRQSGASRWNNLNLRRYRYGGTSRPHQHYHHHRHGSTHLAQLLLGLPPLELLPPLLQPLHHLRLVTYLPRDAAVLLPQLGLQGDIQR